MVTEPYTRSELQSEILKCLLSVGDSDLWEEAVLRSLQCGDAMFQTFDRFGRSLLDSDPDDDALPLRLLNTIEWTEQLMKV
jgi:hypothetical protein